MKDDISKDEEKLNQLRGAIDPVSRAAEEYHPQLISHELRDNDQSVKTHKPFGLFKFSYILFRVFP